MKEQSSVLRSFASQNGQVFCSFFPAIKNEIVRLVLMPFFEASLLITD